MLASTQMLRITEPIVVSLFDQSGNMVEPWAEAGFLCYCVDSRHPVGESRSGNVIRVGADVREWWPPYAAIRILFAFPPCTDVAVSGARWFRDKGLGSLIQSLQLFDASVKIAEWTRAPYMIENPISTISTYWRKPDHMFNPCDYGGYLSPSGDAYTKKTCLWTGNGFAMPEAKKVPASEGSRMHRLPPSKTRSLLRSETPKGFAQAVFESNYQSLSADSANASRGGRYSSGETSTSRSRSTGLTGPAARDFLSRRQV